MTPKQRETRKVYLAALKKYIRDKHKLKEKPVQK